MDYKKVFDGFEEQNIFIKTTPPPAVEGRQKAALNRKGNELYNSGHIEAARRVFLTTGYSDGLSRIGDYYKSQGRLLEALKMYWIAPDKTKSEPIIMQLSAFLQGLIHEGEDAHE
jgi:tetratricopeptide (TPR) repeat protein